MSLPSWSSTSPPALSSSAGASSFGARRPASVALVTLCAASSGISAGLVAWRSAGVPVSSAPRWAAEVVA